MVCGGDLFVQGTMLGGVGVGGSVDAANVLPLLL